MANFTSYTRVMYTEGSSIQVLATDELDLCATNAADCNPRVDSKWISLDEVVQPTNAHLRNYIECGAIIGNGPYMRGIATHVEMADAKMSADAIIDLVYRLPPRHRESAMFLFGSTDTPTRRKLLSLTDVDGRHLVKEGVCTGEPDRLIGYPLVISNLFDGLIFGDMAEAYVIAMRHTAPRANSCWVGSGLVNPDAVRAMRFTSD